MIYKLYKIVGSNVEDAAMTINVNPQISFIFSPTNTDYANFKKEILADEAQLQDADGNVMADAKAYVASLP
jgi:hypothetical protein